MYLIWMQNLQQRKIPVICTCMVTVDREIPGRQLFLVSDCEF